MDVQKQVRCSTRTERELQRTAYIQPPIRRGAWGLEALDEFLGSLSDSLLLVGGDDQHLDSGILGGNHARLGGTLSVLLLVVLDAQCAEAVQDQR